MKKSLRCILILLAQLAYFPFSNGQTIDIPLPHGVQGTSSRSLITVLSNGNFVYSNPNYSAEGRPNIGMVRLYNGKTFALITSIGGNKEGDQVGDRVYALPNGNFVVSSQYFDGGTPDTGGVWWVNGVTGAVTLLTGSSYMDQISIGGITVLSNGNYLVNSYRWTNGTFKPLGAVTWCSGTAGRSGVVSSANSLIGSTDSDFVGTPSGVTALSNGNYVICTPDWDNGPSPNVGAVTFGNGTTGTFGVVNASNSLTGSNPQDQVGSGGAFALTNGNYVVCSEVWKNGSAESAGAATWANGTTGLTGIVTAANSLVGSKTMDRVGNYGVTALANGNYVVRSGFWINGSLSLAGAATWGNGTTGIAGEVSPANSFVGGVENSAVSLSGVTALTNGNYVISSSGWSSATTKSVGAVTWADGNAGIIGEVSEANSLVGQTANERMSRVTALTNGHYVVSSPGWIDNNGQAVGAVVWADGSKGLIGKIDPSNAITGLKEGDGIGSDGVLALSDGNYIISSRLWDSQTVADAGAITWMNGSGSASGQVTESNSLYGSISGGLISLNSPVILKNGSYIFKTSALKVTDPDPGTVTWGNGSQSGEVSATNSLVGSHSDDEFGFSDIGVTGDGNYFVINSRRSADLLRAGSVTWGNGVTGTSGSVNDCNSVIGKITNGGFSLSAGYNEMYKYLIVGRGREELITIYYPSGGPFLAKSDDESSVNLDQGQATHFLNDGGCRILASLTSTGASPVTGTVNARVWVEGSVPHFGNDPFVARHYEITPADKALTATGRLTIYFSQDEFNAFNAAPRSFLNLPVNANDATGKTNLRIGKYSGTSSDGSGLPGTYASIVSTIIDPDDDDIVWNDAFKRWEVTFDTEGFSGFVVQTSIVPLPVRLVSFNAKAEEKTVKLNWEIADAVNVSHFEIERSIDGKQFEFAGKVNFNASQMHYAFTDHHPRADVYDQAFYRLKMQDLDETYAYSRIVAVRADDGRNAYAYPNPASDLLKISLPGQNAQKGTLKLIDASGQTVLEKPVQIVNGEIQIDLKQSRVPDDIYTIQLDFNGAKQYFRLVKTR